MADTHAQAIVNVQNATLAITQSGAWAVNVSCGISGLQ